MTGALPFLDHDGEMARRIREQDWTGHPLGPPESWPSPLAFALDMALASSFPTAIYWGPDFRLLYNDAWAPIPADRHPWALGRAAAEVWADIWEVVGPQMEQVLRTGKGFVAYDQMLAMARDGQPQETWWNYSFTAIRDAGGAVLGVFNQGNETTRVVRAEQARVAQVERLRELFQQAPAAVALLRGPDHLIEMANPAYRALVGNREILGKTIAEALPEVVEQGFVALLDQVFRSGEAFSATATPVSLQRAAGEPETRILDFVYQPIKDANGRVTDIFVEATDVTERARAEEALRHSEERLQLALDASSGLGTWEWSAATGRLTGDERFARLFGIAPERVRDGTSISGFLALVHPDDRERMRAALAEAVATRSPLAIEYRVLRADGGIRWLLTQGRCYFDATGKPQRFPGMSFDITERKAAEQVAQAAAEELRTANEAQAYLHALAERQRALDTPAAIMRFTAASLAHRLGADRAGFARVADASCFQFGSSWSSGQLPVLAGEGDLDTLGASDRYRAGDTIVTGGGEAAADEPARIGVPLIRSGSWAATLYVDCAGRREWTAEEIGLVQTVAESSWDAVERVGAVAALRISEEKFRAIANSIEQMIWSTRPDGYHDYYNDRWYEYTGVPHGSTDGEAWNGMFHPEDQERAWAAWRHSLATGEPYRIEYRLRHHTGDWRWVLGRAQPVRDESGRITRWFGTCTDIQEIVDAREVLARSRGELEAAVRIRTEQLMAAEDQLRQLQKMESIGQLTGGIAHDFNNMLAVVIGALDLLERRLAQGRTDVERYVTAARDGATRATALTQRLLAFSRQQPLAPVALDANRMIAGLLELLVRTLGEEVAVETALAPDLDLARADPNQLENVLLNLAVNGRDAMPGGGTLTIETANAELDTETARGFDVAPGRYVRIAVADTGSGMSREVAARAFDPFFTTKGVGKGTGLGLSQVFGFVRQSGGHVGLESAPGAGTRVSVYLPVHAGPAPAPEPARAAADQPRGREDEVVMVVEDEDRVRAFSVEALRELGYQVVDARDGPEALRLIDLGQPVSLLFTDIVMPEMTGRQLAERAQMRIPGLRVLFTSGYSREEAEDDMAGAVLAKPFDLDRLAVRVRAALDGENPRKVDARAFRD